MVPDSDLVFHALVSIDPARNTWKIDIREQFAARCEWIVRSDLSSRIVGTGRVDEAWDMLADAGWHVDRESVRRDGQLMQTVANAFPVIDVDSVESQAHWSFLARCVARCVPLSVAREGWREGFREPVEFSEHEIWRSTLGHEWSYTNR